MVGRADVEFNIAGTGKSSHIIWNTYKSKYVMHSFLLQARPPISSSAYSGRVIGTDELPAGNHS